MKRKNILYGFVMALISLCLLHACMQKEEPENLYGVVEFVVRPTKYNGQDVKTRATSVADFEDKIHNCYFLLFNNAGNRTFISNDLGNTLATQRFNKQQLAGGLDAYTNSTACFIANVPKSVVEGITTLSQLNSVVLDITYSSVDVFDIGNNKNSSFVVPEFDLDDNSATASVQCMPMFGMTSCDLTTNDLFQIPLKRLFSKITIEINLAEAPLTASYDLLAAHLYNLPIKVNLTEPAGANYESVWVKDPSAFLVPLIEGPIDEDNDRGINRLSSYNFYFYVPEYYLQPLPSNTTGYGDERYKPNMYDKTENNPKYPLFVRVFGTYKPTTNDNDDVNATYDLYLGEDASTSFTLKRNIHYTNKMVIKGTTNSINGSGETLDCRVEFTEEHNEVVMLGQTANCYIIGKTGKYIYPACKGVYKGGINNIPENLKCTKGTTLEILAQDNTSIKIENLIYNKESGEFSFEVTTLDGGSGFIASNDGNVVLGLTYTENGVKHIEWSWHIWVCSGSVWGIDAFEISTQTYPNGYMLMDRNLGAKPTSLQNSGAALGLYYRYGQREPFIIDKRTGLNSTDKGDYYGYNNTSSDWSGTTKAQTDPCPPGYKVPSKFVWEQSTSLIGLHNNLLNAFEYWDEVYYPYAGYLNNNCDTVTVYSSKKTITGTYTDIITSGIYSYKDINYSMTINYNKAGTLLGTDKTLVYEGADQGILSDMKIISCLRKSRWGSSWSTYTPPSGTLANTLINSVKTTIEGTLTEHMRQINLIDSNSSYGYQVRCVKE